MTEYKYWVYILFDKRAHKTYIGVTNNLSRRVFEHKLGLIDGYSKDYNLTKLAYYEEFKYINNAIAREKLLKKWHRAWKHRLIETINPNWDDLAQNVNEYIATLTHLEISEYKQSYRLMQKQEKTPK